MKSGAAIPGCVARRAPKTITPAHGGRGRRTRQRNRRGQRFDRYRADVAMSLAITFFRKLFGCRAL
jgi:hypothetical protein